MNSSLKITAPQILGAGAGLAGLVLGAGLVDERLSRRK